MEPLHSRCLGYEAERRLVTSKDSEVLWFTAEDLESLRERTSAMEARYKELLAGSHETTSQTSETWHDNPAFDDIQQQSRMYYAEFRKLKNDLDRAQLIEAAPTVRDVVAIGSRVHVVVNERATFDVVVCSYRCFHESTDDIDFVSYVAPLASSLLGKKVGDEGIFQTGDRRMSVVITGIVSEDGES